MGQSAKSVQASGLPRPTKYVKSGCRTCKIRHVKCDEKKPACRKCTSSGRVCDGYGVLHAVSKSTSGTSEPLGLKQAYLPISRNPGPFPGVGQDERSSLEYFRQAPALKLTGLFKSEFWDSLVLQTCLAESSVLHAVVALAAAHRSRFFPREDEKMPSIRYYESFSLTQYNKAIKSLTAHVVPGDLESVRIAITASLVFVCLEMLRGEYHSMNMHFQHGNKMLNFLQLNRKDCGQTRHVFVRQNPQSTDEHLIDAFARLHLQFIMLGPGLPDKYTLSTLPFAYGYRQISVPRVFSAAQDARRSLEQIFGSVIQLAIKFAADHMGSNTSFSPLSPTLLKHQETLQLALEDWIAAFDNSLSLLSSQTARYGEIALRILRIHSTMASILVSTCFATKETAFDSHTSEFESIIEQIKEVGAIVTNTARDTTPPKENNYVSSFCRIGASFSVDLGCYAPLYFTAIKCRAPRIRRHAISILRQCRHTEGIWTGPLLARLATCVADAEERDFSDALHSYSYSDDDSSSSNEVRPPFILPEYSRFYCIRCILPKESRGWRFSHHSTNIEDSMQSNKRAMGTLICHRFCHEWARAGDG